MPISLEDRLLIRELIDLYGHLIDARNWRGLDRVFTGEAVYDMSAYPGGSCYQGLDAIRQLMRNSNEHPVAHHATNIVIDDNIDPVQVHSKGIGVGRSGRVGSVDYVDSVIQTERGWRLSERQVWLRGYESKVEL